MNRTVRRSMMAAIAVLIAAMAAWSVYQRGGAGGGAVSQAGGQGSRGPRAAVAVEVESVTRGRIEQRRTFSGSLSAASEFAVAPKVSGRLAALRVDIGDPVERGQVVAQLDDDEFVQAVAQAEAELAVAQANLMQASSALEIAQRDHERVRTLGQRGIASEAQIDAVEAQRLSAEAEVEVARAQVRRAEANLTASRIRLSYTSVTAAWPDDETPDAQPDALHAGPSRRVVGERYVDAGDTVAANAPLLSVVQVDRLRAVFFVTERDYARLRIGQTATLDTDAHPGRAFEATLSRMAPVFRQTSRQARVELTVDNDDGQLRPGMFARISVLLDAAEDAVILPATALVQRGGRTGVFVLDGRGEQTVARYVPVEVGLRDGERVQVIGQGVTGSVVTLGQQLLEDGAAVRVVASGAASSPPSFETSGRTGGRTSGGGA